MGWTISLANNVTTFEHQTNSVVDQLYAISGGQYCVSLLTGGTTIQILQAAGNPGTSNGFNLSLRIDDLTEIGGDTPEADIVDLIAQIVGVMPVSESGGGLTLNSPLTGLTIPGVGGVAIEATDSILEAFGKIQATLNTL